MGEVEGGRAAAEKFCTQEEAEVETSAAAERATEERTVDVAPAATKSRRPRSGTYDHRATIEEMLSWADHYLVDGIEWALASKGFPSLFYCCLSLFLNLRCPGRIGVGRCIGWRWWVCGQETKTINIIAVRFQASISMCHALSSDRKSVV